MLFNMESKVKMISGTSGTGTLALCDFIDDLTRYVWVYILKGKSEVFNVLKSGKHWLRNHQDMERRQFEVAMAVNMYPKSLRDT